ncbi:MAG TPA: PAS domain S-box protein [Terriglobales bacterium]|nr:PAS domain S-box protein [Terriglobales bacterium]
MGASTPVTSVPDAQLFRDIFNTSPIGIAVENLDGQPLFVNPALCRFLSFTEEELRSKHCVDLSPKEDAEKDWALFQQLRAGAIDHYQMEKRYFRRDGSLVWGSLSISLLNSRPSPLVIAMVEDITEKKTAEEARFRHAAIIESSEDAIASGTLDGTILSWNAGAERIYGYTEAEAVGKSIAMLVPPELPDEENKILETLRTGGRIEHFETIRVTKSGKKINVSLSISPIKDSSGRIVGISGIARDITEQKRTEDKLREYERAVEAAEEMITVVDREYRILVANRKYATMRNMAKEEIVGRFAHEVLNKAVFEGVVKPKLDECFQGKVVRYEMKYTYPGLGERDVLVSYFPIQGATGVEQAAGIFQDITERKRAEESLREGEERLRLAVQAGKMYAFEWDVTTDVLVRSPEYVNVLGAAEPRTLTHQQVLEKIHPDDRAQLLAAVARHSPKNPRAETTYRVLLPGKSPVWVKSSGRAFFDGEGRMLRVIGMVADVTDQKLAEEAVSDMTRKLVEAQEQERTRIARELHDDIGQRLAILEIGLVQLQQNRPDLPSEVVNRMHDLQQQSSQISADVQTLSHDLHCSQLEYLGVVAGMKSWCKEFGERQGMQIDCTHDVRSTLPPEIGLCLFRVLQEALHNAAKHSGVKRIEVELSENSGEIHLTIRDLGKGFDVEAARQGRGLGLTSMQGASSAGERNYNDSIEADGWNNNLRSRAVQCEQ